MSAINNGAAARKAALTKEVEALSDEVSRLRMMVERSVELHQQQQAAGAGQGGVAAASTANGGGGITSAVGGSPTMAAGIGSVPFLAPDQPLSVLPAMFAGPDGTARLFKVMMDTYPWLVPQEMQDAQRRVQAQDAKALKRGNKQKKRSPSKSKSSKSKKKHKKGRDEDDADARSVSSSTDTSDSDSDTSSSSSSSSESSDSGSSSDSSDHHRRHKKSKKKSSKGKKGGKGKDQKGDAVAGTPKGSQLSRGNSEEALGSTARSSRNARNANMFSSSAASGAGSTASTGVFNAARFTPSRGRGGKGTTRRIAALNPQDTDDDDSNEEANDAASQATASELGRKTSSTFDRNF